MIGNLLSESSGKRRCCPKRHGRRNGDFSGLRIVRGGFCPRRRHFYRTLDGALWETRTDKMYNCQFAPDGRLTALSQSDGEWAIVVDDAESEEHADYLWGTRFNKAGTIAVPMQTGMEYGMLVDGAPWEQLYTAATDFVLSETAKPPPWSRPPGLARPIWKASARASIPSPSTGQAWEECYLNACAPLLRQEGHRVASTVRVTP